jgi:glycerate kinase
MLRFGVFAASWRGLFRVPMSRRFLIAPDKFKGSLSAPEAAAAIADGIRRVLPDAGLDLCPIADGGEGFMETLAAALGGRWVACPAVDALGRPIDSRYLLAETAEGRVAVLEMAETAGLWRLAEGERDPRATSTRGTGMQIAHAASGPPLARIVLGLGGSATNDGGAGMAAALGVAFLDGGGGLLDPVPRNLPRLARIDAARRIALPEIVAACDVENPLLGERGATAVFAGQKGATADDQPFLEAALARLVAVTGGEALAVEAGAGAAGGLGFGLRHFAGARLVPGFELLAGLLDLERRIRRADHVVTGEGSLDSQSLAGKGPVALARLAGALGVPVSALCGRVDPVLRDTGLFQSVHALTELGLPDEDSMRRAGPLLADLAARQVAGEARSGGGIAG